MRVRLLSTLRIGMALFLAVFANGTMPMLAQTALAHHNPGDTGYQEVWCQHTNVWTAQQGSSGDNPNRVPLKILPDGAPPQMHVDEITGQVWTDNSSYDQMKGALDAACVEQQTTVSATAPTVTPVCGPNNDTVDYATTENVTYSDTGWSGGSNTVTATADKDYVLTGTTSWLLTDTVLAGCQSQPPDEVDVDTENSLTCADGYRTRTITTTTSYIQNQNTGEWELGTPGAPVNGDWTFVRDLTPAEKTENQCPQPEKPNPVEVNTNEERMSCLDGVETRIKTVTTSHVFNTTIWDWVLDPNSVQTTHTDWVYDRDLNTEEMVANKCVTPEQPGSIDVCEPEQGSNGVGTYDKIQIPATTGVNYYIDGVLSPAGEYSTKGKLSILVTVAAQDDYTLVGDYPTNGWQYTFTKKDCKVTICHATDSNTNPYVRTTIDSSAIDEENNTDLNGHGDHTGPVWNSELKKQGKDWGDIIPPFTNDAGTPFYGYNWDDPVGQAIWENDCEFTNIVKPTIDITPLQECVVADQSNGVVRVTVTNPNDIAMNYRVILVGQAPRDIMVPGEDSQQVDFAGLAAGTYTVNIYQPSDDEPIDYLARSLSVALIQMDGWDLVDSQQVTLTECPPIEVTPEVLVVIDECGINNDRYILPTNSSGITYSAERDGLQLIVTATPNSGYVLAAELGEDWVAQENGTASWTYTFTDTPCLLGITDICPNLTGSQETVPDGYTKNSSGDCVKQIASVDKPKVLAATPTVLPATGTSETILNIIGLALGVMTYIVMMRLQPSYEA